MSERNNLALHFKYFAFIAFMVIIALATDRWSEKQNFTAYLSNAATMTSLLLGVVAIFYSFISNDSMSRSLGSITTVSSDVREAKQQIEHFVEMTKTATDESTKNTTLVSDASRNLSSSLADLDDTLHAIADQNDALKDLVASLPIRMEQLENKVGDVAKAIGEKPQQPQVETEPSNIPNQAVEKFLARAALNENLLSYACVLAAAENKFLALPEFTDAIGFDAPNAFKGFINCMNAIQLCSRRVVRGQNKYRISNVHPQLIERAKPYFISYLDENYTDNPDEKEAWMLKLRNVEALFQTEA